MERLKSDLLRLRECTGQEKFELAHDIYEKITSSKIYMNLLEESHPKLYRVLRNKLVLLTTTESFEVGFKYYTAFKIKKGARLVYMCTDTDDLCSPEKWVPYIIH